MARQMSLDPGPRGDLLVTTTSLPVTVVTPTWLGAATLRPGFCRSGMPSSVWTAGSAVVDNRQCRAAP